MARQNPLTTISVRVNIDSKQQLEALSDATGRTKSFLVSEAINHYLAAQAWQITATKEALEKADKPDASFVDHDQVASWVDGWDVDNESDLPR